MTVAGIWIGAEIWIGIGIGIGTRVQAKAGA